MAIIRRHFFIHLLISYAMGWWNFQFQVNIGFGDKRDSINEINNLEMTVSACTRRSIIKTGLTVET